MGTVGPLNRTSQSDRSICTAHQSLCHISLPKCVTVRLRGPTDVWGRVSRLSTQILLPMHILEFQTQEIMRSQRAVWLQFRLPNFSPIQQIQWLQTRRNFPSICVSRNLVSSSHHSLILLQNKDELVSHLTTHLWTECCVSGFHCVVYTTPLLVRWIGMRW